MSADRFRACLAFTWRPDFDGQGFHDTPNDRGGATSWGVTIGSYAAWRAEHGIRTTTPADLARATKDELAEIYCARYWTAVSADHLFPGLDLLVFDFGVGSGPIRSAKMLQAAVGVKDDGHIGPLTLAAVGRIVDRVALLDRLGGIHFGFYRAIPGPGGWVSFGRGWSRRNTERLALARRMAQASTS